MNNYIHHNRDNYHGIEAKIARLPHIQMPHTGSWGLPDFGLTEAIGDALGFQRDPVTQGSQVFGGSSASTSPTPTSTSEVPSFNNITDRGLEAIGQGSTGGTGGTGSTGGTDNTQPSGIDPILQEIENLYGSSVDYLNKAAGRLQEEFPRIQQGIQSQFENSLNSITTDRDISAREIDSSQQQGEQRKEDAMTSARRLFNELTMGGQQRFGGASSAGEAFQALSGRELQRNFQGIEQNFSNFMGQVSNARTTLNERFNQAKLTLETQKNSALDNARREFQNKLSEIDRLKAGAAAEKANMRLEALQSLRNQVFQINLANAQLSSSLDSQRQQAETELASAVQSFAQAQQGAGAAQNAFSGATTLNPETSLTFNGQAPSSNFAYTGQIDPRDEEFFTGQINPRRDDLAFA